MSWASGGHPHPVDRLGRHGPHVDQLGLVEGVGHLQPGQVDDLLHQPGQPGGLDEDALGEPLDGLGVVLGAEHGLGEQRDAADRGLQLVADVRHEVAADLLDPPGVGVVLGEDQHVRDRDGRDPHPHHDRCRGVGAAGQVELGLADHAVAAHLPGEVAQLVVDQLAVAHQPVADRGRRGVDDGVAGVDDDGDRAQHREHVADPAGQRRLRRLGLGAAALRPPRGGDGHGPDDEADRPAEHRRERGVHEVRVRGARRRFRASAAVERGLCQKFTSGASRVHPGVSQCRGRPCRPRCHTETPEDTP